MSTINDRIKKIVDELFNGNVSAFARKINIPQPTLKDIVGGKLSTPRADILEKIFGDKSLNVSAEWLLSGKGEMLKNISENSEATNNIKLPDVPEIDKNDSDVVTSLLSLIKEQGQTLKEIALSKDKNHVKDQESIIKEIQVLQQVILNQEKQFQILYKKIDDLISQNNISEQKQVS